MWLCGVVALDGRACVFTWIDALILGSSECALYKVQLLQPDSLTSPPSPFNCVSRLSLHQDINSQLHQPNVDGDWCDAEFNLNDVLGNDEGRIHWDGVNFADSVENVEFHIEGGGEVPVLRCFCRDSEGEEFARDVNLAERIQNENGRFIYGTWSFTPPDIWYVELTKHSLNGRILASKQRPTTVPVNPDQLHRPRTIEDDGMSDRLGGYG
ncbi:unnamed protein product [Periconia digitata]|uniref:Cyanovirin-N domain-containing protein n=1 Tax=Periconia digitata TaxID=1303443 RepID=A0A9W4UI59_9PLEO|nr:unnamed protein product [Periconia digitata]